MIYEFHPQHTASIKALGVQQNDSVKPSTRFSIDKMLMFAKLSLRSFIYDLCKTFMFPNQKTKAIYQKYGIDYIYVYQILTDTDSTSLQFIIFCKEECKIPDSMFREILFKVIVENKVLERFDVSHEFWEQVGVRDVKTRKSLGLFETEHIDDPCQVTIAVNPKEYIEKFESDIINKKHKGVSKNEISMDLASFGIRINSVQDIENFGQLQKDTIKQKDLQ